MAKYCNNKDCKDFAKSLDDSVNFCGSCGRQTVTQETMQRSLISGQGNAVQNLNENSNNTTTNTNISHNTTISSGNVTTNNTTNIVVDRDTIRKMDLDEKVKQYRTFCEDNIRDGIINKILRDRLDDKADELGLNAEICRQIEERIKGRLNSENSYISSVDEATLNSVVNSIRNNAHISVIKDCIPKLRPMAEKYAEDGIGEKVHFYFNMLLAVASQQELFNNYKNIRTDSYWRTFWTSVAYFKNGNKNKAEEVKSALSRWEDYPQDNPMLLNCCGEIFSYPNIQMFDVKGYFKRCVHYSDLLKGVYYAVKYVLFYDVDNGQSEAKSDINFFIQKLWDIKLYKPSTNRRDTTVSYGDFLEDNNQVGKNDHFRDTVIRATGIGAVEPPKAPRGEDRKQGQNHNEGAKPASTPVLSTAKKSRTPIYVGVGIAALVVVFLLGRSISSQDNQGDNTPIVSEQIVDAAKEKDVKTNVPTREADKKEADKIAKPAVVSSSQTSNDTSSKSKKAEESTAVVANPPVEKPKPAAPKSADDMTPSEALSTGQNYLRSSDFSRAVVYIKSAADRGSSEAQYEIAKLLMNGSGIAKNMVEAFNYMKLSAESGFTKAYRELGEMYHGGRGVAKDRTKAEYWYKMAVDAGDQSAKRILNRM